MPLDDPPNRAPTHPARRTDKPLNFYYAPTGHPAAASIPGNTPRLRTHMPPAYGPRLPAVVSSYGDGGGPGHREGLGAFWDSVMRGGR